MLTDNYLRVRVPVERPENERVRVRITAAGETLAGEIVATAGPAGQELAP